MQIKEQADTTKRDKLLKTLISQGMSNASILKIVTPMRGKTQAEKEEIAGQLLKKMGIE